MIPSIVFILTSVDKQSKQIVEKRVVFSESRDLRSGKYFLEWNFKFLSF